MEDMTTRRSFLRWGVVAGMTGVTGCSTFGASNSSSLQRIPGKNDWPSFHYDQANTGHPQDYRIPTKDVKTAWTVDTGARIDDSVAVSEGHVFVANLGGQVYAIDEKSGDVTWKSAIRTRHSAPAVADNNIVLGTVDRGIVSLDPATGDVQWSYQTERPVHSPPTIADGVVYVGGGLSIEGVEPQFHAIDVKDGTSRWTFETEGFADDEVPIRSAPAVVDGTVYMGIETHVYAFDTKTGTEQWRFKPANATVDPNKVDPAGPTRTGKTTGRFGGSPAVADGTVYIGNSDHHLYAIDAETGTEQWRFETGYWVYPAPSVDETSIYLASWDGDVYALHRDSGEKRWEFETQYPQLMSSPAVVDGTVCFGHPDNHVYALATDDGTERWRYNTQADAVNPAPAVVNGTVYIGDYDGTVHALQEK